MSRTLLSGCRRRNRNTLLLLLLLLLVCIYVYVRVYHVGGQEENDGLR